MIMHRIQELRTRLTMSQHEFGKQLAVSRDVIVNLEHGRVQPKDAFLDLVCKIYNVNKDWLYNGAGEMFKTDIDLYREIEEGSAILEAMNPKFRVFALEQLRSLLAFQNDTP